METSTVGMEVTPNVTVSNPVNDRGNIMRAHAEWRSRPADQRFLTLESLYDYVSGRTNASHDIIVPLADLKVKPFGDKSNGLVLAAGDEEIGGFNSWSFQQICTRVHAPREYLQTLPNDLAASNLNHGIDVASKAREDEEDEEKRGLKVYVSDPSRVPVKISEGLEVLPAEGEKIHTPSFPTIRAITSGKYGRIRDMSLIESVMRLNEKCGGRYKVPPARGGLTIQSTTLYASDRDCFIFLVDEDTPITIGNETLHRGFYCWNSEVGSDTIGLAVFLYRYVCQNRIIWGAQDAIEFKMRHSKYCPERFMSQAVPIIESMDAGRNEGVNLLTEGIGYSMETLLQSNEPDKVVPMLRRAGFTKDFSERAYVRARDEEGQVKTRWDLYNGLTATARDYENSDERTKLETLAGDFLMAKN